MANTAMKNGTSPQMRLDPYQGTHHFAWGDRTFKLDRGGAVVRKTLSCGLPVSVAVPTRAFKGIAAQAIEDDSGRMSVSLQLLHHDSELSVPLLQAESMDDIAADWHSWSRVLSLPMLLLDLDGKTTPAMKQLGKVMLETPWQRRKRITAPKRRPNFLRRRKKGVVGTVERLEANELIARR